MLASAETIGTLAADYAMQANFEPGKTEAVIVLRGRGAAAAQARLCFDAAKAGYLPMAGGGELRVVVSYRHLGVSTSARDQGWGGDRTKGGGGDGRAARAGQEHFVGE